MHNDQILFQYLLGLGDNALILSQRLGEWCGHGPVLEQDMALTNIALDLLGQSSFIFEYAAEVQGLGKTEDDLAFLRDAGQFRNCLLVEQPNQDWAFTIARQFFFDVFSYHNLRLLRESEDTRLAAFAEKSLKEVTYHLRFSSDWMLRLGDGTDVSHSKIQTAVDDLWMFTGELTTASPIERAAAEAGFGVNPEQIRPLWQSKVEEILTEATLKIPAGAWMQSGGKEGRHSEQLGFVLADMQFLQRAYPGGVW